MARLAFPDLVVQAEEAGVESDIIDTARKLETRNAGVGVAVLVAEMRVLNKKVSHPAQFVKGIGADSTVAFYEAWQAVVADLDTYSATNRIVLVLDVGAMKEGPAALESPDALFMVSRRKAGNAITPRNPIGELQTTPADVAILAAYLITTTGTEPEVFMNLDGAIRVAGTLQIDGQIVADEDGTEPGGKTYADYRAWHAVYYPTGSNPSRIVGVVMPSGDMSVEKAVRQLREAGQLTQPHTNGQNGHNGHNTEDLFPDSTQVLVTADGDEDDAEDDEDAPVQSVAPPARKPGKRK